MSLSRRGGSVLGRGPPGTRATRECPVQDNPFGAVSRSEPRVARLG